MGHIKNVEAFEQLLAVCTGYGGQYNPGQQNLQLESMISMLGNARIAVRQVIEAKTSFNNATNSREVAFGKLDKLVTRILGELSSSGALDQTIADARSVVRQLVGRRRASRQPELSENTQAPAPSEKRTRASGSDFYVKEHYFAQLLQIVAMEPRYQPKVEDLKVQSLMAQHAALQHENAAVAEAAVTLAEARRNRNALMYRNTPNLHGTAMAVKEQVKAIFGFGGEAYRAVSRLSFTKPVL
jgi:hypothetical protein